MSKISFVIPAYNEQDNIRPFFDLLKSTLDNSNYDFEAVFVDDGSTDNTLPELEKLYHQNDNIKIISFSRNFGKDAAIYAGVEKASGDFTAIIDADLQQLPETVIKMAELLEKNSELSSVAAYQEYRNEPLLLRFFKKCFYKIINSVSKVHFRHDSSDFRIMKNDMKEAFLKIGDKIRFTKGIYAMCGFNTQYIPYVPEKRRSGKSKWSFASLFTYALSGIFSFADKFYLIPTVFALVLIMISILYFVISTIISGITGFSILLSVILLLSGVFLGISGLELGYLGHILSESKERPKYIIKKEL